MTRSAPFSELPLLEIHGATVVKSGIRILDDLSLTILQGESVAILGPNGSGKSSLVRLLTRQDYPLLHPDGSPVVRIFGKTHWNVATLRSLLGIVSADLHFAFTNSGTNGVSVTGEEAALTGFFGSPGIGAHHRITDPMRDAARKALNLMGALPLAEKPLAQMSTGEARRVLIARALAPDPRALLLDEPTTGLDLASAHHFLETIRTIVRRGTMLLLVTHHIEEILPEIERVILLKNGRVFHDGAKEDVLRSEVLSALLDTSVQVRRAARPGCYSAQVTEEMPGDGIPPRRNMTRI
ncbi:MAG: ATP-binding cassette domain-containing protein [Cytophagales bacterium]|nr:ATP-binding cassette domain-containing protein [Armatimonadota bacterium]